MRPDLKKALYWLVAALVIFLFWNVSARVQKNEHYLSFSDFIEQVERGHVNDVTFTGNSISGVFKNGQGFRTFAPTQAEGLVDGLLEKGVVVNARDNSSSWLGHIISWIPIVIMISFLIFFMRQMRGGTETVARVWDVLSRSEGPLTEAEISSQLSRSSRAQLKNTLYSMVREGTIVLTTERKYRAKTVD